MSFKLSDFIAAPSQELLDKAKKSDLLKFKLILGLLCDIRFWIGT